MQREIYLSTDEGVEVLSMQGGLLHAAPMRGAGTLCLAKESLFCADEEGVIWRMNRHTLMPQAVFQGGPGICDLLVSRDGVRLYALLAEADSILMLDASSGRAQIVCRCGCNPQHMVLCGDTLAAAGGESGCLHLYDAHTLETRGEVSMPGPVQSIVVRDESVFALCLTAELNTVLVRWNGACCSTVLLEGMPGYLYLYRNTLFAAVYGALYAFSPDDLRLLFRLKAPGRASKICAIDRSMFLHDPLSQRLWRINSSGQWRMIRRQVRSFSVQ